MAIGEKINLKFEVSCGRPVVYEWMKRGVREDVTVSPPEVSVRSESIEQLSMMGPIRGGGLFRKYC